MTRVKVCGIAYPEDIDACAVAGVDAIGFIFTESPRRLSVPTASALIARVPPFLTTVGVFADSPPDLVRSALERCRLDVLQFSGDEPLEYCGSFGRPTIVPAREPAATATQLRAAMAIAVLADSRGTAARGGTGIPVDRPAAARMRAETAAFFILAGGLTAQTVAAAVAAVRPDAVDVRSGVERDGRKDPAEVQRFVSAARLA
ncbi:MAG: phosphoribosylanthranilate isomerase [Candidatus Eremiobacteraeota bacterium]|nr:phosphoribosylanthranilate isomerase [Candidatus Eremiobacteraeota bacterium]